MTLPKKISENTSLSIGVFLGLVGGIIWLSHVAFLSESSANAIESLDRKQDRYSRDLSDIKAQMSEQRADIKYIRQRIDAP